MSTQEPDEPNPVAPTILRNEPFGEYVEGLSYCGDESYVIEHAVQKHDFEYLTFFRDIGGKPFVSQTLGKFKNSARQVGVFVVGTVENVELQLHVAEAISEFGLLRGERGFVNFFGQTHVEQAVLLSDDQRFLTLKFMSLRE